MKHILALLSLAVVASLGFGCQDPAGGANESQNAAAATPAPSAEPERVANTPPLDPNNAVSIALGSKDHTTLVAALKAADYVTAVSNPGPLTVFAPTNAAFDKLPPGTVETLVKPENLEKLQHILKSHVTTSVWETRTFKEGMTLSMANGAKTTLHVKDGKFFINDAEVVASIPASNGIVHVVDGVLLPPSE